MLTYLNSVESEPFLHYRKNLFYKIVQITHMDSICAPYILKRALYIIKYTIVHNFLVHNLPTGNFVLPVSKFLTGSDRRR